MLRVGSLEQIVVDKDSFYRVADALSHTRTPVFKLVREEGAFFVLSWGARKHGITKHRHPPATVIFLTFPLVMLAQRGGGYLLGSGKQGIAASAWGMQRAPDPPPPSQRLCWPAEWAMQRCSAGRGRTPPHFQSVPLSLFSRFVCRCPGPLSASRVSGPTTTALCSWTLTWTCCTKSCVFLPNKSKAEVCTLPGEVHVRTAAQQVHPGCFWC